MKNFIVKILLVASVIVMGSCASQKTFMAEAVATGPTYDWAKSKSQEKAREEITRHLNAEVTETWTTQSTDENGELNEKIVRNAKSVSKANLENIKFETKVVKKGKLYEATTRVKYTD